MGDGAVTVEINSVEFVPWCKGSDWPRRPSCSLYRSSERPKRACGALVYVGAAVKSSPSNSGNDYGTSEIHNRHIYFAANKL